LLQLSICNLYTYVYETKHNSTIYSVTALPALSMCRPSCAPVKTHAKPDASYTDLVARVSTRGQSSRREVDDRMMLGNALTDAA